MNSKLLRLFYSVKPLMPRSLQLMLRKQRAQKIFKGLDSPFLIEENNHTLVPVPEGYDSVVLLTHDVETQEGLSMIEPIRKIERAIGVKSTWNFVLDKYGTHPDIIRGLQDEGCECGAHGLTHDGKLFADKATYDKRMKQIVEIANQLNLKGFRSPALHRNAEWMKTLPFKWDSSFPAWDPFQPQPGGCEQYSPFKLNNNTWELPVTLFQDFTLFYELEEKNINIWIAQATALAKRRKLINIIVHPDYMTEEISLLYQAFIRHCREDLNSWITTPAELCNFLDSKNE